MTVTMFKKQSSTKLFRSTAPSARVGAKKAAKKPILKKKTAKALVKNKTSKARKQVETCEVGVWDIDVHSGYLNRVLDAMNRRQQLFKFSRIEATVPMGLTLSGNRTRAIVKEFGGNSDDPAIGENVLAKDVYRTARPILKSLKTDLLVCVVAPMIMDHLTIKEDGKRGIGWDFFSVSKNRIALVSAYGLRQYAEMAGRPFEACLAALIAAQVFVESFRKVRSHDETRGCILDYCDNRDDIVASLRTIGICDETAGQFPPDALESALKILDAIREYKR
jgi:hypothetical protein